MKGYFRCLEYWPGTRRDRPEIKFGEREFLGVQSNGSALAPPEEAVERGAI
jgi:hypothetical protein